MYCKNCGKPTVGDAVLCPACGGPAEETTQMQAASAAPTPVSVPPIAGGTGGSATIPTGMQAPLVTNRALWKMILLGIVTLGIYPVIAQDKMVHELNLVAYRWDGKITLSPTAISPLMMITLSIYYFVYTHQYVGRIQNELNRRHIAYGCGPVHFWLLSVVFGWTLICPLIYSHKVIKAQNLINQDYNQKGV